MVRRFADMEIFVEIQENVRGADVFVGAVHVIPGQRSPDGVADHHRRAAAFLGAAHHGGGACISAMPGRTANPAPRTPISAKLVANLITHAGADRVLTLDLHAGQIQGFFDIPTDNLFAAPVMVRDIKERFDLSKLMVVSPDVGGVVRARGLAKRINAPLAIIDKRRERAGESEVMNVIGDVAGHTCILIDDIVDSGGTLVNAADALLDQGATDVYALYYPRRVVGWCGGAREHVAAERTRHHRLDPADQGSAGGRNIRVLPIAHLIGEADRPYRARRVGIESVRLKSLATVCARIDARFKYQTATRDHCRGAIAPGFYE